MSAGYHMLIVVALLTSAPARTAQEAAPDRRPSHRVDVRLDSGRVDVRMPAPEALRAFRDDPGFAYDRQPPQTDSGWARFKAWLAEKLFSPLERRSTNWLVERIFWILAGLGLIYAVLKLLRMEPRGLFYGRSDRQRSPAFAEIEDLQEVDFDGLVQEATAAGDFRRAVRLLYLKTLKALAARALIAWQPEKTNHEYLRELEERPQADLAASFSRLTYLFEYIWYGDFPVDARAFERARGTFSDFDQTLDRAVPHA